MRSIIKLLCVLVILTITSACSEEKSPLRPLSQSSTILAFGDSLTYGTGASKNESYPAILGQLTGIKVINEGVAGEVSGKGKNRLGKLLTKHQPNLVILCHGGNDLLQKIDNKKTISNLKSMITMIEDSGSEVVLLSVPRPGLILKAAPFYEEIATEMDIPLIAGLLSEILSNRGLKSDTAHPNEKGYRQMAQTVAELLKERKAISQLN